MNPPEFLFEQARRDLETVDQTANPLLSTLPWVFRLAERKSQAYPPELHPDFLGAAYLTLTEAMAKTPLTDTTQLWRQIFNAINSQVILPEINQQKHEVPLSTAVGTEAPESSPENQVLTDVIIDTIFRTFARLPGPDQYFLKAHYGLLGHEPTSLVELEAKTNFSIPQIRLSLSHSHRAARAAIGYSLFNELTY